MLFYSSSNFTHGLGSLANAEAELTFGTINSFIILDKTRLT